MLVAANATLDFVGIVWVSSVVILIVKSKETVLFTLINISRFGPFLGLDMKKDPSFSAVWKDPSVWKIMDAG